MNDEILNRFSKALSFATISFPTDEQDDLKLLEAFQSFLVEAFPHFHARAERHSTGPFGVWYRLPAKKEADPTLKPVLFLAHYDVVPVSREAWEQEPFSGKRLQDADGKAWVYGRGSLDTKNTLMGICEALEALCAEGLQFDRDIYLAFGGDEEKSGARGAKNMAQIFREKGLHFELVLDEGAIVSQGMLKGLSGSLALIGLAEKGFLNIELNVPQIPGHASRPPKKQAAASLGRALARLEKKVFKPRLIPTVAAFFQYLAPQMKGIQAFAMKHPKIFAPLLLKIASSNADMASMVQTTLAMTRLEGSSADNVMPHKVQALLNIRILPGETIETVVARLRHCLKKWPEIQVKVSEATLSNDPIGDSPAENSSWKIIAGAIREVFDPLALVPYLVTATTDSRYYAELSEGVYRFAPMELDKQELDLIHGHNERISEENYLKGIQFFKKVLQSFSVQA